MKLSLVFVVVIALAPQDVPPQCDQPVFARSNPGLCYPGFPFGGGFPGGGSGGGGGDGGLLGKIGKVLGGLTGGIL